MHYLLIDEVRFGDAELATMRNLAAALFRLEKSRSPEEIRSAVRHLIEWLKAPEQLSLRRAFTVMLGRVLLPRRVPGQTVLELNDLQEVDAMLAETVWNRLDTNVSENAIRFSPGWHFLVAAFRPRHRLREKRRSGLLKTGTLVTTNHQTA